MWECSDCGGGIDTLPGANGLPVCFGCDKPVSWRSPLDGKLKKLKPSRSPRKGDEEAPPRGVYQGPPDG